MKLECAVLEQQLMNMCKVNSFYEMVRDLAFLSKELDEGDYLDLLEYTLGDIHDLDTDLQPLYNLLNSYIEYHWELDYV